MSQRYLGGIVTASPTAPTITTASGEWTLSQQLQYNSTWPKSSTEPIARSLRFRSSASAYLNRTPASTTNRRTFTWSGWVKRGILGIRQGFFSCQNGAGNASLQFGFFDNDCFQMGNGSVYVLQSTALYRDPAAWYHFVVSVDTTLASNRCKVYLNGNQTTSWATNTFDATFAQNSDTAFNQNLTHYLGQIGANLSYLDGYMAEINFIDGQALTPAYFGYTDVNGIWQPSAYTGTYGTNGFYLNFSDNSNNTAATIGKDYSGNGNNWTPNNISVTSGSTYDSMTDVPTLTSATAANYAVINPLNGSGSITNGNLSHAGSAANWYSASSTISFDATQNIYAEVTIVSNNPATNGIQLGVIGSAQALSGNTSTLGGYATGYSWQSYLSGANNKFNNGTGSSYNSGATYTTGDVIGIQLNAGTLTFYKNGVSQGSAFTGLSGSFCFGGSPYNGDTIAWNFGQQGFKYTPPTGAVALMYITCQHLRLAMVVRT